MFRRLSIAQWFLITGAAFAVIGLLIWALLPIHLALPPYLFTPVLALGYGAYCRRSEWNGRIEGRE